MWTKVKDNAAVWVLIATIAQNAFLALNFEFKTPRTIVSELQAQVDRSNNRIDSLALSTKKDRELLETSVVIQCQMADDYVADRLPCARILREKGFR